MRDFYINHVCDFERIFTGFWSVGKELAHFFCWAERVVSINERLSVWIIETTTASDTGEEVLSLCIISSRIVDIIGPDEWHAGEFTQFDESLIVGSL